ncbi:MAG: ribonuclease R [Proteobacteria bacterium]|nr:ribonuclease R [Pseudomonadota bacterium]
MKSESKKTRVKISLPARLDILNYLTECNRPRTLRKIADALGVEGSEGRQALLRRIKAMQRDGQIVLNRRGGYGLINKMDLHQGTVIGHPDGYGFLNIEDQTDDLYLSAREMRCLLHGDRIIARLVGVDKRGRKEGAMVEILQRANQYIVGRYFEEAGVGFVVPENKRIHQDILIPTSMEGDAKSGQYVVVHITKQPDKHTQPVGKVMETLGDHAAAGMAIEIAIRSHEIPSDWPEKVIEEVTRVADEVKEEDICYREDIRHLPLVTIDGADARDFDDAVYCESQGSGWRLLVAIADVSHYVHPGMAMDVEALNRGNSVYFPQRVVPMLPEILSNGLCSLNPKVDRLCIVCELHISKQGEVKRHRFFEGVMRSVERMTYDKVSGILIEKDKGLRDEYEESIPHLENLYALCQLLNKHRQKHGVLDFRTVETYFEFDEDHGVSAIHALERNDAHRLIEEFMLAANIAAAEFLLAHEIPALYRVHESPKEKKLEGLHSFLGELGLHLGGSETPTAKDYASLIEKVKNREDAHLIETVLLRSMQLAIYSENNMGHFGLAFPAYTHFTSPIRRYPDLMVHRAIRHLIHNKNATGFAYSTNEMHGIAEHCSATDRRAEEATRDVVQWYKCELMQGKVGENYEGTISGVTSFGMFVELDDIYVEGLVHITALPVDYYHYDPIGHRLTGERGGKSYRLGNRVKVRVMRVSLDDKKIDFELVE